MSLQASQITTGPSKGFYTLSTIADRTDTTGSELYQNYAAYENALDSATNSNLYYKYSPGPGKSITGFNKTMLPQVGDYYYVSKSYSNVRKLLYALENRLIPSSGNTELFNVQYNSIYVPDNWRPYYIDPPLPSSSPSVATNRQQRLSSSGCVPESVFTIGARWFLLLLLCIVLAFIIAVAFVF